MLKKILNIPSSRLSGDSGIESPSLPKVLLVLLVVPPSEYECSALTGNSSVVTTPFVCNIESVNSRSLRTGVCISPVTSHRSFEIDEVVQDGSSCKIT